MAHLTGIKKSFHYKGATHVKTKLLLVAGIIGLLGVGNAHAFDWFDGRLSIGGGYGRVKPELPYDFKDSYQDGPMWTANMKYFINNDVSIVASYADLEPYARGDSQDFYRFRPIVASIRYNIFHHLPITPYLTAGAGYSFNEREAPGIVAQQWSEATLQGGVGFEFFITEGTSLGVEALYHNFIGQAGIEPYRMASLIGTANIYFGPGPSQKRAEEALKQEQAAAAQAQADAEAAKQQALAAAQMQVQQASATATSAQQEAALANQKLQQLQAQNQQAQAELDNIKQMIARKDISPITFKSGSADLLAVSNPTLDKVAQIIKKYPDLKVRIEGHTDNVGSDDYNQQLSQERADAVKNYLVNQAGVPAGQVTSVGMGKGGPVADNSTLEGRAQNRRVEFITYIQ